MNPKLPHMPLWVFDLDTDRDCRRMDDATFGRYMRLLIRQWIEGSIPANAPDAIRDACLDHDATDAVKALLDRKFSVRDGSERKNQRCAEERDEAIRKVEVNRENGKRGGRPRNSEGESESKPNGSIRVSGSGSEFSSSPKKKKTASRFDEFWALWPRGGRRKAQGQCREKWATHNLDATADEVMDGLRRWLASAEWAKDGGKYIPAPLVWLNQASWEAEPVPKNGAAVSPAAAEAAERKAAERREAMKRVEAEAREVSPEERKAMLEEIKRNARLTRRSA